MNCCQYSRWPRGARVGWRAGQNDSPICATNQLIINFQEKSVMAIDAAKRGAKGFKDTCKILDHTQAYQLVGRF